jgi:AhpD family alkylhydroperoxidase
MRERIALAVAQHNPCTYCLSTHTYLAEHVADLDADDIAAAPRRTRRPLRSWRSRWR